MSDFTTFRKAIAVFQLYGISQSAQQHIHSKLIDKAKEHLVTTTLSVAEIAYLLGFKYPQSFNKLFKAKTNLTPLEYRKFLIS